MLEHDRVIDDFIKEWLREIEELLTRYNYRMAKHVIHISELEASSHFTALLAHLREGEEIVIEDDSRPVAVVHPAEPLRRTISESIALAEAHAKESGYEPTLDLDFATDLEEIIKSRKPRNLSSWD